MKKLIVFILAASFIFSAIPDTEAYAANMDKQDGKAYAGILQGYLDADEIMFTGNDAVLELVDSDTISETAYLHAVQKEAGKAGFVCLGRNRGAVVTEDGSLYMWGSNLDGELGDGTREYHDRPIKVLENVRTVSLGVAHSGAVTKDGSLYMWGSNFVGELGDGTHEERSRPVKVLEDVQTVSLGSAHSGAVTRDGSLYMWGSNDDGELGDGTYEDHNRPVKVLENIQAVSLGDHHSGAVTKDGNLYMWGSNLSGELGDGTNAGHNRPVKVLENIRTVSLGDHHSGAVTKDGSLYMWGVNLNGELGDGTHEERSRPVKVLEDVRTVSLGDSHSGAVTKNGNLYMWGNNSNGMLGDGTYEFRNRPVKVLKNVQMVSLGFDYSGAVTKDGSLYLWGGAQWVGILKETNVDFTRPKKISFFSTTKTSQKITYHSTAIKKGKVAYGLSFSLNAKTTGIGKLTYKSSNTKILSVNAKGRVTVKGYGPVSIQIRAAGGGGYKAAVRKIKLTAVPRQGKITKAEWQKSGVRIQWKPEKTADGYEYVIAYNKKFSGQSRKKTGKTGLILTKYKMGTKQMFIKVRTYKKVGKKTYYGSWSEPRSVKLKKSKGSGSSYAIAS